MNLTQRCFLMLVGICMANLSCSVPPAVLSAQNTTQPVMIGPVPHINANDAEINTQANRFDEKGEMLVEIENSDYQVITSSTRRTTPPAVTDEALALKETQTGVDQSRIAIEKIKVTSWTPHHIGGVIPWVCEAGEVSRMKVKGWVYQSEVSQTKSAVAKEDSK